MIDKIQEKNVSFDFLQPQYLTYGDDGQEPGAHPFHMKAFLQAISESKLPDTKREINGDAYLFHCCQKISEKEEKAESGLWEMQILHLRQKVLPGSADEYGDYDEMIDLPDGRYPAESTTLMYSERKNILYLQRNVFGISIRNLEEYLTKLLVRPGTPEAKNRVMFAIVRKTERAKRLTQRTQYKKVILSATVDEINECRNGGTLQQILQQFKEVGSSIAKLELSVGRKTNNRLSTDQLNELVEEASRYAGITKLKAKMSDADDTSFSMFDFLEDKQKYVVKIEYSKANPIKHERLLTGLLAEYYKA